MPRMSPAPEQTGLSQTKPNPPGKPTRRGIERLFPVRGERLNLGRMWPKVFVIVALILACRQPYALIHPTFYAEDGAVFFKQQYEMGFGPSFVTRYAGYPHFAPRILAGLCSVLPIESIPLAYTIVCLLIAAGTLTFFIAPGFRPIINSDFLRVSLVFVFTLMPNADPLMKLADVNWYMVLFTALLIIYSLPERRWVRWLLFIPAAMATWSNPMTVGFLPAMLYRAWKAGDEFSLRNEPAATAKSAHPLTLNPSPPVGAREERRVEERIWWLGLALLTTCFALVVEKQPGLTSMILHETNWMVAMFHSTGYRVFCFFFLGPMLMYPPIWGGWGLIGPIGLALGVLCVVAAVMTVVKVKGKGIDRFAPVVLLYLILALPALFILRKPWQRFFLNWSVDAWQENDRYFFSSTILMCILCGVIFERLYRPWMIKSRLRRDLSLFGLVVWLTLQGFGFQMDAWHKETRWSYYAQKIHETEARVQQTGHYETVSIEGSPAGWDFKVVIKGRPQTSAKPAPTQ